MKHTVMPSSITVGARRFGPVAALCSAALLSQVAYGQDASVGQNTFGSKCQACHSVGPGARNGVGPKLNDLKGRKAGSIVGYVYSAANRAADFKWDESTFVDYIRDPKSKVPGTKMPFDGIKDAAEAEALWAFLSQYDGNGNKR